MAINASNEGGSSNFAPVPAGTHVARCYQMIELGTVTEPYMGEMKTGKKVRLSWELPLELKEFKQGEGESPFVISKDFTLSLHEKATLRKFLESWRGKNFTDDEAKSFDITKLLGVACMVSVINETKDQKTYGKLTNVSTLAKGMVCPPAINKQVVLSYDMFDFETFNILPKFIKEKMEKTPEFAKIADKYHAYEFEKSQIAQEEPEKDLPF